VKLGSEGRGARGAKTGKKTAEKNKEGTGVKECLGCWTKKKKKNKGSQGVVFPE